MQIYIMHLLIETKTLGVNTFLLMKIYLLNFINRRALYNRITVRSIPCNFSQQ